MQIADRLAPLQTNVFAEMDQAKAQAIVDYREQNGAFTSVDAITAVKGIGPSTLANNSDRIKLQ